VELAFISILSLLFLTALDLSISSVPVEMKEFQWK
jgi:hypothetical protein